MTSQSPGVALLVEVGRKRVEEEIKEEPLSRMVHILFIRRSYIPRSPSSQRIQPDICQPSPLGVSLVGWTEGVLARKRLQEDVAAGVVREEEEEEGASGWGPITSSATSDCTNPEGCCVEVSAIRVNLSMSAGWAVIHPRRQPGAMVLEKVSRRTTRPSTSMEM